MGGSYSEAEATTLQHRLVLASDTASGLINIVCFVRWWTSGELPQQDSPLGMPSLGKIQSSPVADGVSASLPAAAAEASSASSAKELLADKEEVDGRLRGESDVLFTDDIFTLGEGVTLVEELEGGDEEWTDSDTEGGEGMGDGAGQQPSESATVDTNAPLTPKSSRRKSLARTKRVISFSIKESVDAFQLESASDSTSPGGNNRFKGAVRTVMITNSLRRGLIERREVGERPPRRATPRHVTPRDATSRYTTPHTAPH